MSVFESLSDRKDPKSEISAIKSNPHAYIKNHGMDVPDNMNNPVSIINHLIQSGQVSGPRAQMARQIMARMGVK